MRLAKASPSALDGLLDARLFESALQLAERIRTGDSSSRDIVELHIDHVRRVNPELNAVVAERFAAARDEAQKADDKVAAGEKLGPLHGVPCTIKECFALNGMPQTSGLVQRQDYRADHDAVTVARLRAAGAIPIGVTNTSELCMWMETNNKLYGRTNNPYDPARIVGGSSGGEGAIVGSGASPFGLGADVGGSIRMPAFFNGVFGHKPTGGRVPGTGQYPCAKGPALRYLTTGPICRKAEDLYPILQVLQGPDGEDTGCEVMPLEDPKSVDLSTLKVVNIKDNGRTRVHDDLRDAQDRVADHLRNKGATVVEFSHPSLRHSFDIWSSMFGQAEGPGAYRNHLGKPKKRQVARELWPLVRGQSEHTLPSVLLGLIEDVSNRFERRTRRFVEMGLDLQAELSDEIGENGVMLYPSYAEPAPRHNKPLWPPFNWVYTAILNVLELPVTQVPLGLNAAGVPLGVQIGAQRQRDHLSLAVALDLEQSFGGWVPPGRIFG